MNKKKVLIITYYWPPSGGSGVQRWLKFVKYLPKFGWHPYVYTPSNPSFAIRDESLLKDVTVDAEVVKYPIWEPYEVFFKMSSAIGNKKKNTTDLVATKNKSLFQKVSTWIRGNFIIPDPRVFWVRPSVKFLKDFLRDNQINIVITTGPPHSMHLIGYKLKQQIPGLRWIADFRDPWSEWGLLDSLNVGAWARKIHKRWESKILRNADVVTTITPFYVRRFEALGKRQVNLLTNGFDADDFKEIRHQKTDRFIIRHVGIVNEKCNPKPFLKIVSDLARTNSEFGSLVKIEFIGEVHQHVREFVAHNTHLANITSFVPPVPHKQLIAMYGSSALLLLVLEGYKDAEGYMPGKLFEYLATGLPILGIGPTHGDAAALLDKTHLGKMLESSNVKNVETFLLEELERWKKRADDHYQFQENKSYSREGITNELSGLLEQLL